MRLIKHDEEYRRCSLSLSQPLHLLFMTVNLLLSSLPHLDKRWSFSNEMLKRHAALKVLRHCKYYSIIQWRVKSQPFMSTSSEVIAHECETVIRNSRTNPNDKLTLSPSDDIYDSHWCSIFSSFYLVLLMQNLYPLFCCLIVFILLFY